MLAVLVQLVELISAVTFAPLSHKLFQPLKCLVGDQGQLIKMKFVHRFFKMPIPVAQMELLWVMKHKVMKLIYLDINIHIKYFIIK